LPPFFLAELSKLLQLLTVNNPSTMWHNTAY